MALKMNGLISLSLTYDRWNCIFTINKHYNELLD